MESKIISPCISICRTDPVTGYCYGCARTNDEKRLWKDENTKDQWKQDNLKEILIRMKGWQLETFKESFEHKKNKGIFACFKKLFAFFSNYLYIYIFGNRNITIIKFYKKGRS